MVLFTGIIFLLLNFGDGDYVTMINTVSKVEEALPQIVQNQERETRAQKVVVAMRSTLHEMETDYRSLQIEYLRVDANYNAGIETYREIDRQYGDFWQTYVKEMIRLRFALRDQLTRDEWTRLYEELDHPVG